MKSFVFAFVTLFAGVSSASVGAVNYMWCEYEMPNGDLKSPVVSVDVINFSEKANGIWEADAVEVSMTYKNAAGKKFLTNAIINAADYSDDSLTKFYGVTTGGKTVEISIKPDGVSSVKVNGLKQTYPNTLKCGYGLAG